MDTKQLQTENEELRNIIKEYKRKWNNYTEVSRRLLQLEDYKADAEYDKKVEMEQKREEDTEE